MDYLNEIKVIIKKLRDNGFLVESEELKSNYELSFTSTELLLKTLYYMSTICNNNLDIKSLIGQDLIKFEKFCNSQGLYLNSHE